MGVKVRDILGGDLSDKERELLRDAILKMASWARVTLSFPGKLEDIELPDSAPETTEEALERLALVNASLDVKQAVKDEQDKLRRDILKAGQKIVLAVIERGLPAILARV